MEKLIHHEDIIEENFWKKDSPSKNSAISQLSAGLLTRSNPLEYETDYFAKKERTETIIDLMEESMNESIR